MVGFCLFSPMPKSSCKGIKPEVFQLGVNTFTALHVGSKGKILQLHSVQLMVFIPVSSILCL